MTAKLQSIPWCNNGIVSGLRLREGSVCYKLGFKTLIKMCPGNHTGSHKSC